MRKINENYSDFSDQSIENTEKILQQSPSSKIKVIISENKLATGNIPTVFGGIERFYESSSAEDPTPVQVQGGAKKRDKPSTARSGECLRESKKFNGNTGPLIAELETIEDQNEMSENASGFSDPDLNLSYIDVSEKFEELNIAKNYDFDRVNESNLNLFHMENKNHSYVNLYGEEQLYDSNSDVNETPRNYSNLDSNESLAQKKGSPDDLLNFTDFVPMDVNTKSYFHSDGFDLPKKNVYFLDNDFKFPDPPNKQTKVPPKSVSFITPQQPEEELTEEDEERDD